MQHDSARLRDRAKTVISYASLAIAPVFVGLAAVTPTLLPLMAGPGWDQSIGIGICLAIGSAIAIPARLVFTALSARARPEYSLIANVVASVVTIAIVLVGVPLGPISVGVARIAGDLAQAVIAIGISPRLLDWTRRDRLLALAPAWLLAAAMGVSSPASTTPCRILANWRRSCCRSAAESRSTACSWRCSRAQA